MAGGGCGGCRWAVREVGWWGVMVIRGKEAWGQVVVAVVVWW
jgi:hypothetical protein